MATWWLFEALPLAATALLPIAIAPLLGISDLNDVAKSYSHPVVLLFMGGFLLAKAIERSGLHYRLAHALLGFAGKNPRHVLAAIMLSTAFLSLWISNTSSAMVMAPIAAAIAGSQSNRPHFASALMLGVAFAATIGGMGSLIGTPPNAIFAAHASETYGVAIGFAEWAAIGLPVATILLVAAWLVLASFPPVGRADLATGFGTCNSAMSAAEKRVAAIAGLTALAWICRPLMDAALPGLMLTDAGIAILAAVLLFSAPDGQGGRLLDWEGAQSIRWDVLILFGGGLALAALLDQSGLAAWIGGLTGTLQFLPTFALLLVIAAIVAYVGELASNTAMAAIFLPIVGAMATSLQMDPIAFMLPVALSASIGFMLPVATPPNAIVFANPAVTRSRMLRAGAPLDLIGLIIAVGISMLLTPIFLG
ncbi:solute carrier family 13 (sodium-dependent dicarboxylate transporter), member 2/3/5 [Jannaschia seohaensis]|uniref:Sodium-dependent dicarboxylate transporter 2/3/5 n=2 Tax=Jannaschia seohaensis TaxID=475081 RepID=A0A2Y9C3Q9_9RHOB|nr:sodium-dependent dicarboxylate transporter 2/3/5 [Jannaschia seohaensis]SSA51912.1 solute carrier family 13 (sodium-dependent dicarboxylate transporter), member 2/3/5 [Jannaschia seohaensis]